MSCGHPLRPEEEEEEEEVLHRGDFQ